MEGKGGCVCSVRDRSAFQAWQVMQVPMLCSTAAGGAPLLRGRNHNPAPPSLPYHPPPPPQ